MFRFDPPRGGEQKMEKERLEKLKKRLEQEKSSADKAKPADADKVQ